MIAYMPHGRGDNSLHICGTVVPARLAIRVILQLLRSGRELNLLTKKIKLISKYSFLFDAGGVLYVLIELAWRGRSHWTMFVLGGLCFVYLGLINEVLHWDTPLWQQVWIGAV